MTLEIGLLLAIIVFTVIAFVLEWLPIDVVALSSLALLLLFGLITPEQAVSGFSNPAVITVMMMFILSEALVKSGLVRHASHRLIHLSGESRWGASLFLMLTVALLSGFINNTAAVAIFIPVAIDLAKHFRFSPSKILLPLSYVSIFGGTCTLIGTSTNLLVSSLATENGLAPIGIFEITPVGLVLLAIGLVYTMLGPMRLLPSRSIVSSLTQKYQLGAFLTEIRIPQESPLVGKTVVETHVNERFGLSVLEILRGKRKISTDLRNTPLEPDDLLILRGPVESIVRFKEQYRLLLLSDIKLEDADLSDENNILMEVQLSPSSQLEGRTLREIDFRRRYGSFVLALQRRFSGLVQDKLAHIPLRRYDTLLVFGPRNRVEALQDLDDFVPLQEVGIRLRLSKRWWLTAAIFLAVVLVAATGLTPILKASILGTVLLLVTRRLSIQQAYGAVSWTVIFLLAAVLPLGFAMTETGLAELIGTSLNGAFGELGPIGVLAAVLLVTTLLTEVISNNAAAVLMVPICLSAAAQLGVDPRPFVIGVAVAASSAFLTPMGYQTNTMVYGPGGYRFVDYLKAGAPLKLTFWIVSTLLIPRIWPF